MTLVIIPPPPLTARLVFMATPESWLSRVVMFDTEGAVSHVAAMMDDGLFMSANYGQGVRRTRDIDELAGVKMQISVDLPMPWPQYAKWRDYLYSQNGKPFDTEALAGIALHWDISTGCALLRAAANRGAPLLRLFRAPSRAKVAHDNAGCSAADVAGATAFDWRRRSRGGI